MSVPIVSPYICDLLLVINNNWHPISYRFGVIAAYYSNFGHFAFLSHLCGLRDNVRCSSWAHWKARSGLPISVNSTFFARRYGWQICFLQQRRNICWLESWRHYTVLERPVKQLTQERCEHPNISLTYLLASPLFHPFVFTSLHEMQTRSSEENSVRPSGCLSHAWIVTKQ